MFFCTDQAGWAVYGMSWLCLLSNLAVPETELRPLITSLLLHRGLPAMQCVRNQCISPLFSFQHPLIQAGRNRSFEEMGPALSCCTSALLGGTQCFTSLSCAGGRDMGSCGTKALSAALGARCVLSPFPGPSLRVQQVDGGWEGCQAHPDLQAVKRSLFCPRAKPSSPNG